MAPDAPMRMPLGTLVPVRGSPLSTGAPVVIREGWDGLPDGTDDDGLYVLHLVGVCRLTVVLGGGGVVALTLVATLGAHGLVGKA